MPAQAAHIYIAFKLLPGFEWEEVFQDAESIKLNISETFEFKGFGWYPLPNGEVSYLCPTPDGKIRFVHFNHDPRNYRLVVELPDLSHHKEY
jgi:hypothetical protein